MHEHEMKIGYGCTFISCPRNQFLPILSPTDSTLSCVSVNSGQNLDTKNIPKTARKAGRKGPMPKLPHIVGKKPNHATIYDNASAGKFLVKWKQAGKWHNKNLSTFKEAEAFAKLVASKKKSDSLPERFLKPADVQLYGDITAMAEGMDTTVAAVFDEYKNAKANLPDGYSLADAVKALNEKTERPEISVPALAAQFVEWKEKSGEISPKYLRHIKAFANKLSENLAVNVNDLTAKDLQSFVDDLNFAVSTTNHYVATLRAFLIYAIDHGYLASDSRLPNVLKLKRKTETVDNLMTPSEFELIFNRAGDILKARYYLVAFVGLRVSEARQWTITNGLTKNCVVVGADIAKKGARRTIDVSPEIVAWLRGNAQQFKLHEPMSEKRYSYYNRKAMQQNSRNVLRHSGISYDIALNKNPNKTAHNFGTSVEKINSNYKELTTSEMGEKWFHLAGEIVS